MSSPATTSSPGVEEKRETTALTCAGTEEQIETRVIVTAEKWNQPGPNTLRFITTLYSFIIMGMNDGAVGALIPYVSCPPPPFHSLPGEG